MSLKDMKNYIAALEKSVRDEIIQLKQLQEVNTKFLDMQSTKESIFRKQRQIAKLSQEIKNAR
tara:strand:+ start:2357 stop:2545 length:189 start_codon:yes stop_codon:yes gene_type:complete